MFESRSQSIVICGTIVNYRSKKPYEVRQQYLFRLVTHYIYKYIIEFIVYKANSIIYKIECWSPYVRMVPGYVYPYEICFIITIESMLQST